MLPRTHTRGSRCVLLSAACLLFAAGCYGPTRTVRVVLRGADDKATWKAVETVLPTLVDGGEEAGYSMGLSAWPESVPDSVDLAPVASPVEFGRRISFGEVEAIKGRTIYVRVNPQQVQALAIVIKARRFIADLPYTIKLWVFGVRLKLIAWWTGKPVDEVFWPLVNQDIEEEMRRADRMREHPPGKRP